MTRRATVSVDSTAIVDNFKLVKSRVNGAEVFCAVKADAYGHGATNTALALQSVMSPKDGFCVATPEEAHELRDHGVTQSILVLQGAMDAAELKCLAERSITSVVHDPSQCRHLESYRGQHALEVWVKVDTGMGRLGFAADEIPTVIQRLAKCSDIRVQGMMSHLACADVPNNRHTNAQITLFKTLVARQAPLSASLANSAAILAWPQTTFDRVRPGIMLYGANPLVSAPGTGASIPLRAAMRVTAPLIARKSLQRSDGIGYGQTYRCPTPMTVGVVAIGYRDGYPRTADGAVVWVNGQQVPVLGRTSMDSIIVNLCGTNATVGSEVVIVGTEAPVEHLAACADTIAYELLCRFGAGG